MTIPGRTLTIQKMLGELWWNAVGAIFGGWTDGRLHIYGISIPFPRIFDGSHDGQ